MQTESLRLSRGHYELQRKMKAGGVGLSTTL